MTRVHKVELPMGGGGHVVSTEGPVVRWLMVGFQPGPEVTLPEAVAGMGRPILCAWVEVDVAGDPAATPCIVTLTGDEVPDGWRHVGSAQALVGGAPYVVHVYAQPEAARPVPVRELDDLPLLARSLAGLTARQWRELGDEEQRPLLERAAEVKAGVAAYRREGGE